MTIHIVTGPPAAGKTTWVNEQAKPGDIVIDYDTLAQALAPGIPADPAEQPLHTVGLINELRAAAINAATWDHEPPAGYNVYVIHAMPDRHTLNRYRKHGYQIHTIDPGYQTCIARAQAERTPRQQAIVQDWYQRRGLD